MAGADAGWLEAVREACADHPDVRADRTAFAGHAEACRERGARAEHLGELWL